MNLKSKPMVPWCDRLRSSPRGGAEDWEGQPSVEIRAPPDERRDCSRRGTAKEDRQVQGHRELLRRGRRRDPQLVLLSHFRQHLVYDLQGGRPETGLGASLSYSQHACDKRR